MIPRSHRVSASACVWIALTSLTQGQSIVINEIHYHPSDTEALQFVELYNPGSASVNLSGWSFTQGITFTFPAESNLEPAAFLLVAKDTASLQSQMTIPPGTACYQWTSSDLDNAGEVIELADNQPTPALVDIVTYDDVAPWPAAADGSGPSLELVNPAFDNSSASVWRASTGMNGTPGAVNSTFTDGPIVFSETPPRLSVISELTEVQVTFAEPVESVVASNLSVNSSLATSVSCPTCVEGVGEGPYVFSGFTPPTVSPISVALAPGSIQDPEGHPFAGETWFYSFDTPAVVINELHYHPADPNANAEFIELYNAEPDAVDISGWHLTEFASPGYVFPASTILPSDDYVVVAKDTALLLALTGYSTSHSWGLSDSLSNGGEPVALKNELGVLVDRVVYSDSSPWPLAADGDGPSLELINPYLDNSLYGAWAASLQVHGTPGAANSVAGDQPHLVSETPARRTATETLAEVTVVFSEPVTGVTPEDLVVAGSAATAVEPSSGPADTYTFSGFAAPAAGSVTLTLNPGGIAAGAVPFGGDTWTVAVGTVIVINELHYHPADPNSDAEFMELYNAGTEPVELDGWVLSDGVEYVFPAGTTLPAGGYLVLALDPAELQQVTGYSGATPWTSGRLDNSGERVALSDPELNLIDAVPYVDRGSWPPAADGDGPSLELLNPRLQNEYGPAWQASLSNDGTPGAQNSVYQPLVAPIVVQTQHSPAIPAPLQDVVIRALVIDDDPDPTVTLYYRQDAAPTLAYSEAPMLDDGFHGDGAAGDQVYGAIVPGLVDGQRLDFTIRASDGTNVGAGPPGHDTLVAGEYPAQTYLCPFVDPAQLPATDFPAYHLITTQRTRNLQEAYEQDDELATAEYDATFIRRDGTGAHEVFYNVIEHYRGKHSLHQHPHSFHIKFAEDQALDSEMGFPITRLILNSQSIIKQHLGCRMFRESFGGEVFGPCTQFVRLHTSPLSHGGIQNYIYINVERLEDDFLESQGGAIVPARFPDRCTGDGTVCDEDADCPPGDSCVPTTGGNLYRGRYNDAHLRWEGWNPSAYMVNSLGTYGYALENNEDNHDWTDLINLCYTLDASTTPDAVYEQSVRARVDEEQWVRWFALHMLLVNREGGLWRSTGDDYYIYFRPLEAHDGHSATLLPWDMDETFGGFLNEFVSYESIWLTTVPSPQRFLRSNAFAGRFVKAIDDLLNSSFAQPALDAWIDAVPDAVFTQHGQTRAQYKNWAVARRTNVNGQIKRQLTLTGVPASPYTSPDPVLKLSGQLSQIGTYQVLFNGQPPDAFSVYAATWSAQLLLSPGDNPIVVQCLDRDGVEIDRVESSVTYDPAPAGVRLTMPTRMVADKTLTLKGELVDINGDIYWRLFNTLGTVSAWRESDQTPVPISITVFETFPAGVGGGTPPADSIRFYNGVGSVSITLDNPGEPDVVGQNVRVFVTVEGLTSSKLVHVLPDEPATFKELSGTLSGPDLTWGPSDGVIHVTGNLTVPAGETLTINPGTLVMVDAGPADDGTRVLLNDSEVSAQGTADEPIFFFPAAGPLAMELPQLVSNNHYSWRGFLLEGMGTSVFSHVFITGVGNGTIGTRHPRPPALYLANAHSLTMSDCVLADSPAQMIFCTDTGSGTYTISRCLFSRVGIGAEFVGQADYTLLVEDCWFTRIGRATTASGCVNNKGCNGDALHVDSYTTTPQTVRRCIFTDVGDDLIDQSTSALPVVEDCILYDVFDKGVSLEGSGGDITMTNCLVFDADKALWAGDATHNLPVYLTNCTFGPNLNSAAILNRQCGTSDIDQCIFWPVSISTCCHYVDYTFVGASQTFCGTGNSRTDPLFVDPDNNDFDLQPGSPAITAGPGGVRIGWLGFPSATPCLTEADCDDGDLCTLDDCRVGVCVHGSKDCSAYTNACNTGVCNPGTGNCEAQPVADGTPCADTEFCDGVETCQGGVCTAGGNPCDDGVACTDDTCNETTDLCTNTPNDANCNDGAFCNGVETCDALLDCQDGPDPCIDLAHCDENADACLSCVSDAECDDGLFCTGVETCVDYACVPGPDPCDDGVTCTDDSCDEGSDACAHAPNDAHCNDGVFCNGVETCDADLGCQAGTDPCPDLAHCDEDADTCLECIDDLECDDGFVCTGVETCVDNTCMPGTDPCDDPCEQCNEDAGGVCDWCRYDMDRSGFIGPGDFSFFAGCYGRTNTCDAPDFLTPLGTCCMANFDESPNGFVGPGDFSGFAGCYGQECDGCATCFGVSPGREAGESDKGEKVITVTLVAVGAPTPADASDDLPRSIQSFPVGETFYVELWANAGPTQDGLAAVHVDVAYDRARLTVTQVLPSEWFGLFARGAVDAAGAVRGGPGVVASLGGCAPLGEEGLGLTPAWVKVATLEMQGQRPGGVTLKVGPTGGDFGVALLNRLGLLDESQIEFRGETLELTRAKWPGVQAEQIDAYPSQSGTGRR